MQSISTRHTDTNGQSVIVHLLRQTLGEDWRMFLQNGELDILHELSSRNILKTKVVKTLNDLPASVNGEITLSGSYLITGTLQCSDTIVLSGDSTIMGIDPENDKLVYTGTGYAVESSGYNFTTLNLSYSSSTGGLFDLTGTSSNNVLIDNCRLLESTKPSEFTAFDHVKIHNSYFKGGYGIALSGVFSNAIISTNIFEDITGTEIFFRDDYSGSFDITENWFKDAGGEYIELEDNQSGFVWTTITLNRFQEAPAFVNINSDQLGFFVHANINQRDCRATINASFNGNTTPVSVGTDWVDFNGTYTIVDASRFDIDTVTNSVRYLSLREYQFRAILTAYVEVADNNQVLQFAYFYKNGSGSFTIIPDTTRSINFKVKETTQTVILQEIITLKTNDQIKVMVRNTSGTTNTLISSSDITL